MAAEFVHLHVHSEYSMLDGALRAKSLAAAASAAGMRAVALTDHGNMFGAIQHYKACGQAEIGAILGCELNVLRPAVPGAAVSSSDPPTDHLVLLAESEQGYRNLVRIVSMGQLEPASPATPSVTLETIAEGTEGLVALTGCLGGLVPQQVLNSGEEAGLAMLDRVASILGRRNVYVELQDHGLPEQPILNGLLRKLADKLSLPVVATNDVHFLRREDGEAQLYLSCIAANRSAREAKEQHHGSFEMFLKSADEMTQRFRSVPEAVRNSLVVAERCSALELRLGKPMLPTFRLPDGHDAASYLRDVAARGLESRFEEIAATGREISHDVYRQRLEVELGVIIGMEFPGYFLIVWDFIRHAKEKGIPVGPGRGSGAGSLVAYSLRITDLDPLEHQLLFERFLNPERVSMPDFDVDFCMDRRDEVIAYVAERYGRTSVAQIATFHELKARSVIKDVGRAMGLEPTEAQRIANLVPAKGPGQMCTISEALGLEPRLRAMTEEEPYAELLGQAQRLEGLTRHAGMHAAGVVISEGPLWDHVPVFRNGDLIVTQYAKDEVEAAGLVKFDFLGLRTLTVVDIAQRLVNTRPDRGPDNPFDVQRIPLDDPATYALLQSGETTGVFQLESSGMQQLFKDLRPDAFEDIVAAVALYRPGPLGTGMVKDFIECKHGRKPIAAMHPLVDELLKPTYGVIVYQEQVMQIAQRLARYSLGGADLLRRAMGKKKPEEMAKQKATFMAGALENGVTEEDAERIFGLLEYFAGYGFNKSHSAAYALITYQTAYLKAHYPVEFLCALLTADRDKVEKVARIIAEGRAWGVEILPPDINESKIDFTVVYESSDEHARAPSTASGRHFPPQSTRGPVSSKRRAADPFNPKIRFGLGAIRGVGEAALDALLLARGEGEPFRDLFDVAQRVDARKMNKGMLEALAQAGALDSTATPSGITRAQIFASIDRALERGRTATRDREAGQTTLFAMLEASGDGGGANDGYVESEPWDLRDTLQREKQALGFYVSGHPLDRYGHELSRFDVVRVLDLSGQDQWAKVRVAGTVEGYRERTFRSGGKVAFFQLEDLTGGVTVKVREKLIERNAELLTAGDPVLVTGKVTYPQQAEDAPDDPDPGPKEPSVLLDEVVPLADAIRSETRSVAIRLREASTRPEQIDELHRVLRTCPGSCPVQLIIETEEGAEAILALGRDLCVEPSDAMLASLERLFGTKVAELR